MAFLNELIDMPGRTGRDVGTARLIEGPVQVSDLEYRLLPVSDHG